MAEKPQQGFHEPQGINKWVMVLIYVIVALILFVLLPYFQGKVQGEKATVAPKTVTMKTIQEELKEKINALPSPPGPDSIFPRKVRTPEEVELFLDAKDSQVLNALAQYGLETREKAYGPDYLRGLCVERLSVDTKGRVWYWDKNPQCKTLVGRPKTLSAGSAVFADERGVIKAIVGCGNFFEAWQPKDAVTKPAPCAHSRRKVSRRKPKPPTKTTKTVAKRKRREVLVVPPPPPEPFRRKVILAPIEDVNFRNHPQKVATSSGLTGAAWVWTSSSPSVGRQESGPPTCDPGGQTDWCY